MSGRHDIGLPEALERAASALKGDADSIRPANGDPLQLLDLLDADGSRRVLEWLLVNEPSAGSELLEAWVDAGTDAVERFRGLQPDGLPKAARKALKRAHHRLRSRGESVPEAAVREVVAKLPKIDEQLGAALLSPLDPTGTRIAYLVESHPAGGARMFVIVLDEGRGVVDLEVFNAGRSKIKQFLRDYTRRSDHPALEAPREAICALVSRVPGFQRSDRPLPRAFSEWRSRIAEAPQGAKTPGELVRDALGAGAADDAESLERVAGLVRERSLGPWPPARELLHEIAQRLDDASTGVVIVSGAARQQQVLSALDDAVERVYSGDFAERTAERLEEAAWFRWKLGEESDARACLAAAAAFRERAPTDQPVARAMLEVVLAPVLEAIERKSRPPETPTPGGDDSLLVKP